MMQMARTFNYEFEELPLVIENGFEAGLITGEAEISYSRDGEWGIEGISFDGYKRTPADVWAAELRNGRQPANYIRKPVTLDATSPLHGIIYHRLENEWSGKVQEAVQEQIEEDRQCAADNAADMKREQMRETV
jgi:hypothetical protein